MSFVFPWALAGLGALPVLWWLHRRLRRPPVRELPSLMFLLDEHEMRSLPRGRRFDAELFLALAAATLLALAAANPLLERGGARRVVRVVVAGGLHARPSGPATEALRSVRAAADPRDEIVIVREPIGDTAARPSPSALLAAARAGDASVRYVIDDRLPEVEPEDITWIAVGDPAAANRGIVAASIRPMGDAAELFVNVLNDTNEAARFWVFVDSNGEQDVEIRIPPLTMRSVALGIDPTAERIRIGLRGHGDDAFPGDDRVTLTRARVPVHISAALPKRLVARTKAALHAALTADGVRYASPAEAKLAFVRRGWKAGHAGLVVLELEPAPDGAAVEPAGAGTDEIGRGPFVQDLATEAVDWVYAAGARMPAPGERLLLARRGDVTWPVLMGAGSRIRLVPDPLRGEPAAVDTPFWPLLVENLLLQAAPVRAAGAGYRAEGILDADSSRLGRDVRPLDPATLRASKPLAAAPPRSLRLLLVLGALLCLGLLWAAPYLRRRLDAGRRAKTHAGRQVLHAPPA